MTEPVEKPVKPGYSKVLVPVAVALTGVLIALAAFRHHESGHREEAAARGVTIPRVGETLPDFHLQTLAGEKVLFSSIKSKVTLVNFWATWCGPCVQEMPSIQKLRTQYRGQGFEVFGVNVDENPQEVLAPFTKRLALDFPSYVDPRGELSERFGISGIPYSVLLDQDRKVLLVELGDRDWFDGATQGEVRKWLGI